MTAETAPPIGSSVKATRPSTATHSEALDGEGGEGGEAGAGLTLRSPRPSNGSTIMHNELCVPLAAGARRVVLIFNLVIYYVQLRVDGAV